MSKNDIKAELECQGHGVVPSSLNTQASGMTAELHYYALPGELESPTAELETPAIELESIVKAQNAVTADTRAKAPMDKID